MDVALILITFYFILLAAAEEHRLACLSDQLIKSHEHGITQPNYQTEKITQSSLHSKHHVRGGLPVSPHSYSDQDMLVLIEQTAEIEGRWRFVVHLVFSLLSIIGSCFLFFLSLWQTSKLFSQGLWSQKFFKGGGYWLVGSAISGFILGACFSFALDPYYICYFSSGFMLIGASVVYVGRRGAIIGTTGGLIVGLTLGVIHSPSISASIVEGILCMFSGVAIGFVPLFPNLKINIRYIQQGLRAAALASQ